MWLCGAQEAVEVAHWMAARPDMLAHASSAIIARANSLERARRCMADLVLREHAIAADVSAPCAGLSAPCLH